MKLGTGRYAEVMARLLTGSSQLEVAADLSAEISPVFVLENDRPEWEFLKNGRLLSAFVGVSASALEPSYARLRNPLGSNVLAVIEAIQVSSVTATFLAIALMGTATTDRVNTGTVVSRDSRILPLTGPGALKASNDNAVGVGTGLEAASTLVSTPYRFLCCPIILAPGSHLDVGSADNNIAVRVCFRYREREIGRYERP